MNDFKVQWHGKKLVVEVQGEGAAGVSEGLQRLLAASNARVPVDRGDLRDSGQIVGDGLQGSVVYTAEHAVVVHENLEAAYDGGEAKFLERAFDAEQDAMLSAVARAVRQALRG